MKIKLLYSCLLLAGTMGTAFAQDMPDPTMTKRIIEEGMHNSKVMDIAFHLTDVSGPRLAGSPGLKRAQDYAVDQLKTWGMVNAKREDWGKFGKGWEVQKNYAAMTVPYYHAIIAIPKAWTPGTNGPIKGEVVVLKIDTITDLDKYRGKLKGKVVMFDARPSVEINFTRPDASRFADSTLETMAKATPQDQSGRRPGGFPRRAGVMSALLRSAVSDFEGRCWAGVEPGTRN
jgi:carboxypeptidase Q